MVYIEILQPKNLIGFFNNLEDKEFVKNHLENYQVVYKDQISDPYLMETVYSAIKKVVPSENNKLIYYAGFKINLGDLLVFNSFRAKDLFLLTKEGFKLLKTVDFSI